MREEKRVEIISSPVAVATADDIYRRLVRPSALRSQPPTEDVRRRDSLSYKAMNLIPFEKEEEKTKKKKKLEDYMDPGLLSEISAKISRAKNIPAMKKKPIMVNNDFESSTSVDLKDNSDPIYQNEEEEEGQSCSSPFRHFDQIALTRFKDQ